MQPIELTILMPCLNEAQTLSRCIEKAKNFLAREKVIGEILIADNGSTDHSPQIAIEQGARVTHVATRGYGAALLQGIRQAQGQWVIMGDADDSYDFSALELFLKKLREGNEFVIGNRFAGGIQAGAMPFLNRYIGNPVLSWIGKLLFRSQINDFHCGLRGFKRESLLQLQLQSTGMEFASEMCIKATVQQLKIAEVPVTLYPDGRLRRPHLRPWRDGLRHLWLMISLKYRLRVK